MQSDGKDPSLRTEWCESVVGELHDNLVQIGHTQRCIQQLRCGDRLISARSTEQWDTRLVEETLLYEIAQDVHTIGCCGERQADHAHLVISNVLLDDQVPF